MLFVPIELFDALARGIGRLTTHTPIGVGAIELEGVHYAAIYDKHDGLRIAAREGSPVTVADMRNAQHVPLESLPPHVRAKIDNAIKAQEQRFLVAIAGRMPVVDADALPEQDDEDFA
jgi:hypothetical protein